MLNLPTRRIDVMAVAESARSDGADTVMCSHARLLAMAERQPRLGYASDSMGRQLTSADQSIVGSTSVLFSGSFRTRSRPRASIVRVAGSDVIHDQAKGAHHRREGSGKSWGLCFCRAGCGKNCRAILEACWGMLKMLENPSKTYYNSFYKRLIRIDCVALASMLLNSVI